MFAELDVSAELDRLVELMPTSSPVRAVKLRLMLEDGDAGLAQLDRWLAQYPDDAQALAYRGEAFRLMNEYDDASSDFEHCLAIDPDNVLALVRHAELRRAAGQLEEALADLHRALAIEPDNELALVRRGDVYRTLGQAEPALADLDRALALGSPEPLLVLHLVFGRVEDALDAFRQGIEMENESDSFAMACRGDVHRIRGDYEQAIADLDRAVGSEPRRLLAPYTRRGPPRPRQFASGIGRLGRRSRRDGDDAEARALRGAVYRSMGRYEEALADIERSLTVQPHDTSSLELRDDLMAKLAADAGAGAWARWRRRR